MMAPEFVQVIAFAMVFSALQLDQVGGLIDIVKMLSGGYDQQVGIPSQL